MRAVLIGLLLLATGAARAECAMEMMTILPAKIDNGRIFIPGAIDGHPVDYLVDLASRTTLLRIAAERMSIQPDNFGSLDKLATFGEAGSGQLGVSHLPLRVAGSAENFGAPHQVAVLGIDFFGNYDAEFDVQHGKITLYKPADCGGANPARWAGPQTVADMVPNAGGSRPVVRPFNSYNFPQINIRLKIDGQDILAALDTGYAHSALSLAAARSLGLELDGPGTIEAAPTSDLLEGFLTQTWVGTVRSVALGEETIEHARIDFRTFVLPAGLNEPGHGTGSNIRPIRYEGDDMMLGADFLIAHRVFISQSQRKVYFSRADDVEFLGATHRAAKPIERSEGR